MTKGKKLKRKARAQQEKMGASYGAARRVVAAPPSNDFTEWLLSQQHRDDPVGDLARDAGSDRQFPRGAKPRAATAYLARSISERGRRDVLVRNALAEALCDWRAERKGGEQARLVRRKRAKPAWAEELERGPIHAVVYQHGNSSTQAPFGTGPVTTACGTWVDGEIVRRAPGTLTGSRAKVSCPKCLAVLNVNGWDFSGGGMCASCDRFPGEGHLARCAFVKRLGCTTEPVLPQG